ncbi:MAG: hypothetical protein EOP56_14190 [Sphingobacteriales bacterium]|nr:MAG: hypothetical protein EOP56_14190 [Sphingobacteriales bacterium]
MRTFFISLFILYCLNATGQELFRIGAGVSWNFINPIESSYSLKATEQQAAGASFRAAIPIGKHIAVGAVLQRLFYTLDTSEYRNKLLDLYDDDNYFVNFYVPKGSTDISFWIFSAEVGYTVHVRKVEINPYVRVGIGIAEGGGLLNIYRKKKNSNYHDDLRLRNYDAGTFYPSIGFRLNIPLMQGLDLSIGANSSQAKHKIYIKDTRVDIYGTESNHQIFETYNAILIHQAEIGIQYHFNKKMFSPPLKK